MPGAAGVLVAFLGAAGVAAGALGAHGQLAEAAGATVVPFLMTGADLHGQGVLVGTTGAAVLFGFSSARILDVCVELEWK